jgi:hypothetical protein
MKNLLIVFAMLAGLSIGAAQTASADSKHAAAKMSEITGELVDMGCYVGHAAKGEKHAECAAKCIAGGMPMGLVTANGRIYLLTMNHANPDPYNKAKEMAGKRVKVSGPVREKGGIKTLDVVMAEIAPAPTAAK